MLSVLFGLSAFFAGAQNKVPELKQQLESTSDDSARARVYGLLAWELKFTSPPEALQWAEKEISYGHTQTDYLRLADGYRVKALILVITEKIKEGMPFYDSALFYARKARSLYYEASCYSLMAGMYGDHADYDKAIGLYAKGLEVAERSGDPRMISTLSNNLAESYQSNGGRTELVQKYLDIALTHSMQSGRWGEAAMNSANLALEYIKNGDRAKADKELERAVDLTGRDKSNAYRYATNCHVLASAYLDLGQLKEAERYATISLAIMDSLKQPDNVLRPLTVLTNVYIRQGNIPTAEKTAARLLADAKKQQAKLYIRDACKAWSDIERLKGNTAAALSFFEQYKVWNDSIFQAAREQSIANMETKALMAQQELQVKYETQKKQQENESLKKLSASLQTEKIIIVGACFVFAVLGLLLYLANRRKQKINRELAAEKKIVERQAEEKGMLVHEIHHRVKNNLTLLKSMLYLQAKATGEAEIKKVMEEFQGRIQSMALVHQSLYEKDNTGYLELVPFIENMAGELAVSFCPPDKEITFTVSGSCRQVDIAKSVSLSLIMNELITNSLKYAFKQRDEGVIDIHISEENDILLIRYTDHGPGLAQEFDLRKGGFGFRLLGIFSQQLHAQISYRNTNGIPEFRIEVPL